MKIKLIDSSLVHTMPSYTDTNNNNNNPHIRKYRNKLIQFDYSPVNNNDKFIVLTDNKLKSIDDYSDYNGIKIAWILEPQQIIPELYAWIVGNHTKFDYVFTHHKWLLNIDPKFRLITFGGCWIDLPDFKIYDKSKMISIVASHKARTKGHQMRHNIITHCRDKMDVFGLKYNYIKDKIDGLKDYRFSVTIENAREDAYFTEKLIDCFATGTIPIYWGCPCIGDFFNTDGMLICENEESIVEIVENITPADYIIRLKAVRENMELAKNHLEHEGIYNGIKELNL